MNGDSIACQNLSLEFKALASRPLSSKDPTINERQYRIAKEIMDIANYLSKSASLIVGSFEDRGLEASALYSRLRF